MSALLPFFVIVPLGAAFLALVLKRPVPRAPALLALAACFALVIMAVSLVLSGANSAMLLGARGVEVVDGEEYVTGIALVGDGLARLFLLVVAVVSTAAAVFSIQYLRGRTGRGSFYPLFCLLIAGMNGVVLAGDIFNLYVFLEIATIASCALVAFYTLGKEIEAAFKYLILGSIAASAILLGIGTLYAATGHLNMAQLAVAIRGGEVDPTLLTFATVLFLMGFGLKAAMMPFHAWLPDAHPSAPAPISAMLSGLLIKTCGIYALVRVLYTVVGMTPAIQTILFALGSISMVVGVLLALGQDDLKRLLAYSSVSQMGYVMVALAANTWLGVAAALFHAANHAAFKSALFLSSGSLERVAHTRKLSEMGGLLDKAPATSAGAIGASLSISGVPPFNGFWSKLLILIALVQSGHPIIAAVAAGTAVLTLATFVGVQRRAIFGALPERLGLHRVREVPASMFVPVLTLVLLCLAMGLLWPAGGDSLIGSAADAVRASGEGPPALDEYVRLVMGK